MLTLAFTLGLALANPISVYDTSDITFDVPNFDNAPRLNMNTGIPGRPAQSLRSRQKQNEEKLDRILNDLYGDEYKIIRWRGHLIVRKR